MQIAQFPEMERLKIIVNDFSKILQESADNLASYAGSKNLDGDTVLGLYRMSRRNKKIVFPGLLLDRIVNILDKSDNVRSVWDQTNILLPEDERPWDFERVDKYAAILESESKNLFPRYDKVRDALLHNDSVDPVYVPAIDAARNLTLSFNVLNGLSVVNRILQERGEVRVVGSEFEIYLQSSNPASLLNAQLDLLDSLL